MRTCADGNEIPEGVRSAGAEAARMYAKLLRAGYGQRWAEMCALQTPPGVKGSDRTWMEGRLNNQQLDRMPKDQAQRMVAEAKKAGINPSGKYYSAGLADKRGPADPMAWVDSLADVKRVAEIRNLSVEGAITVKGTPVPPSRKPLSERLTKELMQLEKRESPKLKDGELRDKVIEKYAYRRGKK